MKKRHAAILITMNLIRYAINKRTVLLLLVVTLIGAVAHSHDVPTVQAIAFNSNEPNYDPTLYAIGVVASSNLYNTFAMLGAITDGYIGDTYDATTAQALAEEAIALSGNSRIVLKQFIDLEIAVGDDRTTLTKIIRAYDLLIEEALGLLRYIDDPNDTETYIQNRDAAWEIISKLLATDRTVAGAFAPGP